MKKSEKYIGKIYKHVSLGQVSVDSVHEGSRVFVNVTILNRGRGFDQSKNRYVGIRTRTGWYRGQNKEFGQKDVAHIKDLKEIN